MIDEEPALTDRISFVRGMDEDTQRVIGPRSYWYKHPTKGGGRKMNWDPWFLQNKPGADETPL